MNKVVTVLLLVGIGISFSCNFPHPFSDDPFSGNHPGPDCWITIHNSGEFLMSVFVEADESSKQFNNKQIPVGESRTWDLYLRNDHDCESAASCESDPPAAWRGDVKAMYEDPSLSYGGLFHLGYSVECGQSKSVDLSDCPGWY